MKTIARIATITVLVAGIAAPVAAQGVDPYRKAIFMEILAENGCKLHNSEPTSFILKTFEAEQFGRDEIRAIVTELIERGEARVEQPILRLGAGPCG